ncbi:hypothetical protein CJP72_11940 [Citrobacter sp. NCU1]|uniref:MarR family transcriptional regulator n=1 Tax=Citrobacter sp. NCU1 TaxID=2026683 RepID=UPI001390EE47|nr:helix-turn-helix domain-containing protein [Citrobacter sp. NCU1]NDO81451.1 hypothetical protein [Citrobacter sp. NCU1]
MNNAFPQLQIFSSPYPDVANRIIALYCEEKRGLTLSRRDFTALLPGVCTDHIRKTVRDLLENKVLARSGCRYRLAVTPARIINMKPHRLYRVDLQILRLIQSKGVITANDMLRVNGVSRTIFLRAAARLKQQGLIESYQEKPFPAACRFYRFKTQEISHE